MNFLKSITLSKNGLLVKSRNIWNWESVSKIRKFCVKSRKQVPYSVIFVICYQKQRYIMKELAWRWSKNEQNII